MKMIKLGLATLLMAGALLGEEATAPVTSSKGYLDIGLGPCPVPLPNFGIGYRGQQNHNGFDFSLNAATVVHATQIKGAALYQYFFKPNLKSQFYVGGGPALSYAFTSKGHVWLLAPEVVFGKQYQNEAGDTRFMQVSVEWPTFALERHHTIVKFPLVYFTYGIMF
ncbi:MAG: hypothetical protein JSR58_00250 [Verrucomicrobia bacterium]|nr:hypothetical protein [Verrucomicrobiota bacterium]